MALATAVISFDISDLVGAGFDTSKVRAWTTTNADNNRLLDTAANLVRVGDGKAVVNNDGTGSFDVWVPGPDGNPTSWQQSFIFEYPLPGARGRTQATFGPYTISGSANLADLEAQQAIPPTYLSEVTGALSGYVDDAADSAAAAAASAASAYDISNISTSDGVVSTLVADPDSDTAVALATSIAAPVENVKQIVAAKRYGRAYASLSDAKFIGAAEFGPHVVTNGVLQDGADKAGVRFRSWSMPDNEVTEVAASFVLPRAWKAYKLDLHYTVVGATGGTVAFSITQSGLVNGESVSSGDGNVSRSPTAPAIGVLSSAEYAATFPGYFLPAGTYSSDLEQRLGTLQHIRVQRNGSSDTNTGTVQFIGVTLRRFVPPLYLFFDGNSLSQGVGSETNTKYPDRVATLLADTDTPQIFADPEIYNWAVSGQTTQAMAADAATQLDVHLDATNPTRSDQILIAWEGTNSMFFGATGAQAYGYIRDYCLARKSAGWKVVVGTVLPRSEFATPADFETQRQEFNSLVRASWPTFADAIMDIGADPVIGQLGHSENTTFYADKTHLKDAGYVIVAGYAVNAIESIATA